MIIIGHFGDEALRRFSPNQHVNIYDVMMRSFLCEATMSSLPEEVIDDPEEYYLEPTDEDGKPVTLNQAYIGA